MEKVIIHKSVILILLLLYYLGHGPAFSRTKSPSFSLVSDLHAKIVKIPISKLTFTTVWIRFRKTEIEIRIQEAWVPQTTGFNRVEK